MKQQAFANFSDQALTVAGLLIFFVFFITVVFWVFRKGSKEFYNYTENIPLNDGEKL